MISQNLINHNINEGLSTVYTKEVDTSDAGSEHGSGALDFLLSTPAILTMIIDASVGLLDHLLPEDFITVTKNIEMSHEKPTMIGEKISLVLTVDKINEDRILLSFIGHDSEGIICRGTHKRVIVNRNRLIESAYKRGEQAHSRKEAL